MITVVGKRQSGKSTQAVVECARLNAKGYYCCIVCMNQVHKRHLMKLATELGLTITAPFTADEFERWAYGELRLPLLILDEMTHLPKKTVARAFRDFKVAMVTINEEE